MSESQFLVVVDRQWSDFCRQMVSQWIVCGDLMILYLSVDNDSEYLSIS